MDRVKWVDESLSRERTSSSGEPDSSPEIVLGDISATARLDLGSERVRLFATNTRLIVTHIGKRGAGALAGSSIMGKLSGAMEDLLKSGVESRKKRSLEAVSPAELLAEKDNFFIPHNDVVRVELEDLGRVVSIMILTKASKFQFVTLAASESVVGLFRPLADRVTVRGKPRPASHCSFDSGFQPGLAIFF